MPILKRPTASLPPHPSHPLHLPFRPWRRGAALVCCAFLLSSTAPAATTAPAAPAATATTTTAPIRIASLQALAEYAAQSGNTIIMRPGNYQMGDLFPPEVIARRREARQFQLLTFSGSDNVFHLAGVTIEADTALRRALRPPMHNNEFVISGDNNTIDGLTLINTGGATSPAGATLSIAGRGNTLRDCVFLIQGSSPYGYGDLFGKGGGPVISHSKQSGVHITGDSTTLIGCRLFMRSYGHGYFVQGGDNHYFEDCLVEGQMRSTDDMLAETSGPAFDVQFRSAYRNRDGEERVTAGYMKSLAEDGFRTYSQARNLTFIHCVARYMRAGFELRTHEGVRLEGCVAMGNERGFWVASQAVVEGCRGDARYGPLLFLEGNGASVELELMATESEMTVHALATIHGADHEVTIAPHRGQERTRPLPILVGWTQPGAGEAMSPYSERPAQGLTLRNRTTMPVVIGAQAEGCEIDSRGPVEEAEPSAASSGNR